MGKRMGVRGRPGLFFVIILVIFLMVFFMTWKSMMTPTKKTEVKDIYSMNFHQGVKQSRVAVNQPRSDLNDIWHHAKLVNDRQKLDGQGIDKDEDYNMKITVKQNVIEPKQNVVQVKSPLSDLLHAETEEKPVKQSSKPYYRKQSEALKIIGGRMNRFIHLDLKGAAPKLSFFKEVFPLFSRLGANGLLIEYEDMFPYSGVLKNLSAENSYSREQINEILDLANLNSLQVIPLIQTFGHMEFVLKSLGMKSLRESEFTPQVIDITSNSSYKLIQKMIEQVLELHPSARYIHIGCDEVYELGKGRSSDAITRDKITPEKLFLKHVKHVASIVDEVSQKRVRPIMWDDELRKMAEDDIVGSGLPRVVDIMIWRYTQNVSDVLDDAVWMKYGRVFKTVWAASSFKGATGSRQLYTEPQHHIINHFSWLDVIAKYGRHVSFKGIALTGWQRYDHFATLCELLPVALPSLAVCLAAIRNGGFEEETHRTTSNTLGCSGLIEMGFPQLDKKERKAMVSQDCRFPGHMVYYGVQQLWGYKQFEEQDRRSGWLSSYQLKRGYSNPGQLKVLSMRLAKLNSNLIQIRPILEEQLSEIYSKDTIEEWVEENILEMQSQIKEVQDKIRLAFKNNHWARRPNLPVIAENTGVVTSRPMGADKNTNSEIAKPGLSQGAIKQHSKQDIFSSNTNLKNTNIEMSKKAVESKDPNLVSKLNSNVQRDESIVPRKSIQSNAQLQPGKSINANGNIFAASNAIQNPVKNLNFKGLKSPAAGNHPDNANSAASNRYSKGQNDVQIRVNGIKPNSVNNGLGNTGPGSAGGYKFQQAVAQRNDKLVANSFAKNSLHLNNQMMNENFKDQMKRHGNVMQQNLHNLNPMDGKKNPFQDIERNEMDLKQEDKHEDTKLKTQDQDDGNENLKNMIQDNAKMAGKMFEDTANNFKAVQYEESNLKPKEGKLLNSFHMKNADDDVKKSNNADDFKVDKEDAENVDEEVFKTSYAQRQNAKYDDLTMGEEDTGLHGDMMRQGNGKPLSDLLKIPGLGMEAKDDEKRNELNKDDLEFGKEIPVENDDNILGK